MEVGGDGVKAESSVEPNRQDDRRRINKTTAVKGREPDKWEFGENRVEKGAVWSRKGKKTGGGGGGIRRQV